VTISTVGLSHAGADSGSVLSTGLLPGTGTSLGMGSAFSGPVSWSNGLRAMIASALGRTCAVTAGGATGRGATALAAVPDKAAPKSCDAPEAWK
jgi:hypothetical protein